jgi:hypothetical protein
MIARGIVTALAPGLLGFALSVLPVTRAEAECKWVDDDSCPSGWSTHAERTVGNGSGVMGSFGSPQRYCCTTPSEPYATGETDEERAARHQKECEGLGKLFDPATGSCNNKKPIKQMGKSKSGREVVKAACLNNGWIWDEQKAGGPGCVKPSQAKANCEAKGSSYHYDLDTKRCVGVKSMKKVKKQSPPEQVSEDDGGDDQPKKKKTKQIIGDFLSDFLNGNR